jgi:histidinol phosphatase-like enzyme
MGQTKTVAVDFDGTLVVEKDGYVHPVRGAAESMQKLKASGYRLVIYTCRTGIAHDNGRLSEELDFINRCLNQFNIPFDEIYTGRKLVADIYIDDRCVSFSGNWQESVNKVLSKLRLNS